MKRLIVCALALFTFAFANAQAKNAAIKANPIGLAVGIINLGYEGAVNESSSYQVSALYYGIEFGSTSLEGFGISPEYRWYTGDALKGFYYGPVIGYASLSVEDGDSKGSASTFNAGGQLGWNWLLGKEDNFVINLGLGAVYSSTSVKVDEGEDNFDLGSLDGFVPALAFSIGYAW